MIRALIDTCIIMDAVQNRSPWDADARAVFRLCAVGSYKGYISASATTDIHYLIRKCTHSEEKTRDILNGIFRIFDHLDTTGSDCRNALTSAVRDYEDAVMTETAIHHGMDCIVSRNKKDYVSAQIAVYSPEEFLDIVTKS